jgi:hypothetical protein
VNCKEYTSKSITKLGVSRPYIWKNTNKLLEKGFYGIKTGITDNAGPCLAAALKKENEIGEKIVKINSLSILVRFHYSNFELLFNGLSLGRMLKIN